MRILCSKGVFVEIEAGIFANTELSRYLQTDTPGSMVSLAKLFRTEWQRKPWTPEAFAHTLRTGQPAFQYVFGEDIWTYLTKHPTEYATLNSAMTSIAVALNDEMAAQACDLTGLHSLVDVGGGEGSFLVKLLLLHPEMTGTLFDVPLVVERARTLIAQTGLTDRWMCIAEDFFQSVPEGRDAYFIRNVLHDWNDEDCLRILRNCRQAIAPQGKLF